MPHPTRTLLKPQSWPAAHRAALAVLIDLDVIESEWTLGSPLSTEAGATRLLTMLADLDVAPTAIIDPAATNSFGVPDGVAIDPAAHIFTMPADLSGAQHRCDQRLGAKPSGIVMLSGLPTVSLEQHELWFMDGTASPFPQRTAKDRVVLPYSPYWHDATWWSSSRPTPPSALLETWSLSLASVRSRGELMTIMLSSELSGLPGHLETILRFVDEAIGAGDVWITNAAGVASYVLSESSD